MSLFVQQAVDGLAAGGLYAALALSLVMVYRASGFVNFAQGEMATIGTYFCWQLFTWGVPLTAAIAIAIIASFIGGGLVERGLIRPLAQSGTVPHLTLAIVTLGVMLVLINAQSWLFGPEVKTFPAIFSGPAVHLGPAVVSRGALTVMAAVVVIAGLLWFLFRRTKFGLAMRASVNDPVSARLSGLPVSLVLTVSWGLAAAIGTLMGALVAPQVLLQPGMLLSTLIYAFAAAILGGLDSPVGAIVGGFIVGVAENLAGTYVPGIGADLKQAVALAIIMLVLLFKSDGLFGTREVVRV